MWDWNQYKGNISWLEPATIFLTVAGSRAYGTSRPDCDYDYRGVAVLPKRYCTGILDVFEQAEQQEPVDLTIYGVKKFIKLAADCNPNIIELLYTEPKDRIIVTELGRILIDNRDMFLSQKAKHTFSGFAVSQLHRLKNSNQSERTTKEIQRDNKHAMHLVRLLTMLREILAEGKVLTKRPDSDFLLSIRDGAWSYETLSEWVKEQDDELDSLMANSPLPYSPDRLKINELCMEIVERGWELTRQS